MSTNVPFMTRSDGEDWMSRMGSSSPDPGIQMRYERSTSDWLKKRLPVAS